MEDLLLAIGGYSLISVIIFAPFLEGLESKTLRILIRFLAGPLVWLIILMCGIQSSLDGLDDMLKKKGW